MGVLKIKLKDRKRLSIKERSSRLRTVLIKAIELDPSLIGKNETLIDAVNPFEFLLKPTKGYTSSEPFREGTLYVSNPNKRLAEIVLSEVVSWIESEETVDLAAPGLEPVKTKLFTQLNYNSKISDNVLKGKLKKLRLFNRFNYLNIDGRVTRCVKK